MSIPNISSFPQFAYITHPTGQTTLRGCGILALGALAHAIQFSIAIPFFTLGGAMITAGLAIKALHYYDENTINIIKMKALDLLRTFPKIQIIACIAIWIISFFSIPLSCCLAVALGIYSGIILDADWSRAARNVDPNGGLAPANNIH